MFSKLQIGLFALSLLSIPEAVLGRPAALHEPRPGQLRRAVVRVVARASAATCSSCATVTVRVSGTLTATAAPTAVTVSFGSAASTASPSAIGNFGSCSIPQIEFGAGFDGRKETAFQPVDRVSYNTESADNIADIAGFICTALGTTCGADATAQATCAKAQAAAAAETPQEGIDADAFNAVFGIQTNFKTVEAISSDGVPIAGSTTNITSTTVASATTATGAAASATASSSSIGNFGSCSVPEIEFGTGFDGRSETSFQPVNKTSYNHASALDISAISQSICDDLANSCGADATAQATCARAQSAANAAPGGQGIDADIFNGFFDISTDFAAVSVVEQPSDTSTDVATKVSTAPATTDAATTTSTTSTHTTSTVAASTTSTAANTFSTSTNLQGFTGNVGGITAPAVVASGSQFQVEGNSLFNTKADALTRSCDVQQNACADAANASRNKNGFTVSACGAQKNECYGANGT
ncbi:hypothetical protein FB451DRAFT_1245088 [Mycena latifolia]|nr:hypothetical protein FB451DRAFT_1245088 [Mycena latifolia]